MAQEFINNKSEMSNIFQIRNTAQTRMTRAGAHIKSMEGIDEVIKECLEDIKKQLEEQLEELLKQQKK